MRFQCPRTCPAHGERWCRFRPILDALGPVRIDSHTVRVAVEYRDPGALAGAVLTMGGTWLGHGSHALFDAAQIGHGFRLPGWRMPLVLTEDGQLLYDDYGGIWGNVADLERLKGEYALSLAEQQAQLQGWQTERTEAGVTVYHPSGGSLTVTPAGVIDAAGFHGQGCHDAITQLGMGRWLEAQAKPEYGAVAAAVQIPQQ